MRHADGARWFAGALLLCALLCAAWGAPDALPTLGENVAQDNLFSIAQDATPRPWATPAPGEADAGATPDASVSPDEGGFELTLVTSAGLAAPAPKRVLLYHTHTSEAYEPDADAP